MTDRKRTKAEERAYAELHEVVRELDAYRVFRKVEYEKLKLDNLPPAWDRIDEEVKVRPGKVRVTAAYDADVAGFFRAMGMGYQARMNAVLRAYMLGIRSREVRSVKNEDWLGDAI